MSELLKFLLLMFLSYFGLVVGTFISNFTKEELKQGKKYFRILKPIFLGVVFYFFFSYLGLRYYFSIPISLVSVLLGFVWVKKFPNNILFYSIFSISLFETKNPVIALLIFMFGLVTASLGFKKKHSFFQNLKLSLLNNIVYPVLCLLLIILF